MTKKIAFTLLALVVTVLPAAAQSYLTTVEDSAGPRVYYQAFPNADIWQIDLRYGWLSADMNLKLGYAESQYVRLPSPMVHGPLVSLFDNQSQFPTLFYINSLGGLESVNVWVDGSFEGADIFCIFNADYCDFKNDQTCASLSANSVPKGWPVCPDGKSLTGFTSDLGPSVFWTGTDGSVWHWFNNPIPLPDGSLLASPWENWLSSNPHNLPCGVVNSALAALPDTRFSPNPLLVFFVGGTDTPALGGGHLCLLAESPGDSPTNQDLTEICIAGPCAGGAPGALGAPGAPWPMLKSPITGFTDSAGVHVFYLDTSGHVDELVLTSNGPSVAGPGQDDSLQATQIRNINLWNTVVCPPHFIFGRPVFGPCPAPSAVADSLTSFTNAFGPQVFYVDTNGHINQLNLKSNTQKDLTSSPGGGVPAMQALQSSALICTFNASLSSIGADNLTGGEDVFYIGNDLQHVWMLHSDDGTSWIAADLTQNLGTPNVWIYFVPTCPA